MTAPRLTGKRRQAAAAWAARWRFRGLGVVATQGIRYPTDMELIFEVRDAEEGGYYARALGRSI
ncbi:MAG TPA: hypothetical protein VEU62_22655, partial [Bryobacterales bacterium]|nr:hypothetical protein [Bryobacterales bacterium]